MGYKLYLGLDIGEGFNIPVLPEKLEVNQDGDNKTFDIINLGEINILSKPKLEDLSFESYFPKHKGPYVSSEKLFDPGFYVSKIKRWREECKPIRVILVGSPIEINELYSIETFDFYEQGGEVGDIYYSLELKQYKSYSAKKVKIVRNNKASKPRIVKTKPQRLSTSKQKYKTHTVRKGDCLWKIAKKYYGKGSRYKEIAKLNNIKNPNKISTGQVLKLP